MHMYVGVYSCVYALVYSRVCGEICNALVNMYVYTFIHARMREKNAICAWTYICVKTNVDIYNKVCIFWNRMRCTTRMHLCSGVYIHRHGHVCACVQTYINTYMYIDIHARTQKDDKVHVVMHVFHTNLRVCPRTRMSKQTCYTHQKHIPLLHSHTSHKSPKWHVYTQFFSCVGHMHKITSSHYNTRVCVHIYSCHKHPVHTHTHTHTPVSPRGPFWPGSPDTPGGPGRPLGPFSPFLPGIPGRPRTPGGPGVKGTLLIFPVNFWFCSWTERITSLVFERIQRVRSRNSSPIFLLLVSCVCVPCPVRIYQSAVVRNKCVMWNMRSAFGGDQAWHVHMELLKDHISACADWIHFILAL